MDEIIAYIKSFLLYGDAEAAKLVGYTADESLWQNYPVVIVPNGHLGHDIVLPDLSHPVIEVLGKTHIVRTDLIYNAFFFISRAEELINPQRDEHGRFAARFSILGQHNNLEIPILDEYAHILLKLLNLPTPTPKYERIYLTHDVDLLASYRHLRGAVGGILRGHGKDVLAAWWDIRRDPAYTYPWLLDQDTRVTAAEMIYFIKCTPGKGYDYPQYCLCGHDYRHLRDLLLRRGAKIGVHTSYYGLPEAGTPQDKALRRALQDLSPYHRAHYLQCSIDDMQRLSDFGITDDFSMAFPDRAGFRLQTTRPVRWINPKTLTLTDLTLHPLTLMDCTLSEPHYMNLTEDEAYFFSEQLLDRVRQYRGEAVLLWHNNRFTDGSYHRLLYPRLLKGLRHYTHHSEA